MTRLATTARFWQLVLGPFAVVLVVQQVLADCAGSAADNQASRAAVEALEQHLAAEWDSRQPLKGQAFATAELTRDDAARAAKLLWLDHAAHLRRTRAGEMTARELTDGDLRMPFHLEIFGDKPQAGRSLYISLHGGGNAPKRVNDGQWENQKK